MSRPPLPPLRDDIEALIRGIVIQPACDDIPPANSLDDYGTTHPDLQRVPTLFALRERWVRALLASRETPMVKNVGIRLACYLDVRSGRCDPSYDGVARELGGVSRATVKRSVRRLECEGWVDVERRGGACGKTNNFTLRVPVRGEVQSCDP